MFNLYLSYKWLYWTRSQEDAPPPPPGLERHWIQTPEGRIEVLSNKPAGANQQKTPILFVHGGMGSAWVWTEYMQFLADHDVPCYAVSMRGHGNSWHPSYLKMVFFTTRQSLTNDVLAALEWAQQREGKKVLLVGHSSGGGISQALLSSGQAQVKGLALLGAVPGFGSVGVYANWARADPWFTIRMVLQGWHPNSPLSHPFLVRRIFFSDEYPEEKLREFQAHSNRYEAFLWPFSMMSPFVSGEKLVRSIDGSGCGGDKILVLTGSQDTIMTKDIMKSLAGSYRKAIRASVAQKKLDDEVRLVQPLKGEGGDDNSGEGVTLAWVPGAGHHLQNDVTWKIGAEKLLNFHAQLE